MKVHRKLEKSGKRERTGRFFGLSIYSQMMIGFCMPILFLILIGIVSYHKAAAGLIENYENSTRNALEMTRNSLDSSFRVINQKVMELGQSS